MWYICLQYGSLQYTLTTYIPSILQSTIHTGDCGVVYMPSIWQSTIHTDDCGVVYMPSIWQSTIHTDDCGVVYILSIWQSTIHTDDCGVVYILQYGSLQYTLTTVVWYIYFNMAVYDTH